MTLLVTEEAEAPAARFGGSARLRIARAMPHQAAKGAEAIERKPCHSRGGNPVSMIRAQRDAP